MGRLLVIGTHGSDDPTKAVLLLLDAKAAIEARHEVALELKGEGTYLIKDVIAENVKAVGWGTAKEALDAIYAAKIPVYV